MQDHERNMLAYVMLADLSQQRRQLQGRNKFLILTGSAACRAGWPEVANRCHILVLADNPSHLLGRFELFTDAMRDADFQSFLKQLERFCRYERAEYLLAELQIEPIVPSTESEKTTGEYALSILSGPDWTPS